MESWFRFRVLCLTAVGIPAAALDLIGGAIRIEHEVGDPERSVGEFRSSQLTKP